MFVDNRLDLFLIAISDILFASTWTMFVDLDCVCVVGPWVKWIKDIILSYYSVPRYERSFWGHNVNLDLTKVAQTCS